MIREEPRTGRVADLEFTFWECWEFDDNVPEALQRHWFRSDTGLEALTYDQMLMKLYRRDLGLPEPQPLQIRSAPSEWERRVWQTLRVDGKDVGIQIIEYYNEESGNSPVSIKIVGPDGLITSSYQEMLELLGIAEERQSALGPPQAEHAAKPEEKPSAISSQLSANGEATLATSQDGKLAAQKRITPGPNGEPEAEARRSAVSPPEAHQLLPNTDDKNGVVAISHNAESEADPPEADSALDARDMEEAQRRGKEFEKRHPWLWEEDRDQQCDEPINSMRLVWWGKFIKAVYPELAAAALDPAKYQAYIDNYDYDRPIPLNERDNEDDDEQRVGSSAPRCQYIKADGEQCDCPALKRKRLCHFHSKTADGRKRKKNAPADPQPAASAELELPVLEDDRAIQMAVTNICRQLAKETIEPKRASTLLYGLQVAAVAVRRTAQKRKRIIF